MLKQYNRKYFNVMIFILFWRGRQFRNSFFPFATNQLCSKKIKDKPVSLYYINDAMFQYQVW